MKWLSNIVKFVHAAGDILIMNFSFLMAYYLKFGTNIFYGFSTHYTYFFVVYNCIWLVLVLSVRTYHLEGSFRIEQLLLNTAKLICLHALILFAFIVFINGFYFSRKHLLVTYLILTALMTVWKFAIVYSIKFYKNDFGNFKQVIIVGAGSTGSQIYKYFKSEIASGYKFLGFFDDNVSECLYPHQVIGNLYDMNHFILTNKVDEIYCALPFTATQRIRELMTFADNNLIRFKIVPDFRGFLNKNVQMDFYNSVPVLTIRKEPLENMFNRFLKRVFDITFSLAVILLIFPFVFPVLMILIKLTSPGPIFFVQRRSGRNNKEFKCYKFRTMKVNEESDTLQACKGDFRITSIGKFLRKTNLDELPQFINTFIGNMSVVGPRPHMLLHTQQYAMLIDKFMVRHLVKPGITGWAQVNGFRGNTKKPKDMIKRVRHDMWYIENWSLLLDMKIIFLTIYNMLKGENNAF